jgi:hypothetical protein
MELVLVLQAHKIIKKRANPILIQMNHSSKAAVFVTKETLPKDSTWLLKHIWNGCQFVREQ